MKLFNQMCPKMSVDGNLFELYAQGSYDRTFIASCSGHVWSPRFRIGKHLSAFFVAEQFRNQGFGQYLLGEIIAHCRTSTEADRLSLDVFKDNERALHVYEKMGFEYTRDTGVGEYSRYYMVYYL